MSYYHYAAVARQPLKIGLPARSACPGKLLLSPASAEMLPAPLNKVLEAQLMLLDPVPESLDLRRPKVMSQAIGCCWCIWIRVSPGVERRP